MASKDMEPRANYRPPDLGLAWARWNSPIVWGGDAGKMYANDPPRMTPTKPVEPVDEAGNPLPWG